MVLFVAVVPAIRFGAARVLGAEVLEFDQTRFTPYISDTAKVLLVIYPVLTLPEVLARQTRLTDFGRRSICTCYIQLERAKTPNLVWLRGRGTQSDLAGPGVNR
jgi:hypothetical protein